MRLVVALFDAPIPARRARAALYAAGFEPADLAVVPEMPDVSSSSLVGTRSGEPGDWFADLPANDEAALARDLIDMGLPAEDARAYAEGVRRGGILLLVRAPTLSVPIAARAIESAGSPDLDEHRQRWAANPATRYGWADIAPPVVDAPTPVRAG